VPHYARKTFVRNCGQIYGATRLAVLALAALTFALALPVGNAIASKQAIAYFGSESGTGSLGGQFTFAQDIAVNGSGAGPAGKGEIYAVDGSFDGVRIQRFTQNDNGTPEDPYDDSYDFVSAWGADVDATPTGGSDYEICTAPAECKFGIFTGGNGTAAGNGTFSRLGGVAVDQDTGNVYVSDVENFRVNVYAGDGAFLRSLGYDVVEAGPDNSGTGYEVCIGANGDVCKAGLSGSSVGQVNRGVGIAVSPADGNPITGTVFLADAGAQRVDTYNLDGSSPSSFGSGGDFPGGLDHIGIDSRGIAYTISAGGSSTLNRYDTQNANGAGVGPLAPILAPPLALGGSNQNAGIEVDPDSDGPGPDKDTLYLLRNLGQEPLTVVQQFGPVNAPGLTAPPAAADDEHGAVIGFNFVNGLGLDESTLEATTIRPAPAPRVAYMFSTQRAGRPAEIWIHSARSPPPASSCTARSNQMGRPTSPITSSTPWTGANGRRLLRSWLAARKPRSRLPPCSNRLGASLPTRPTACGWSRPRSLLRR
jgi:NHL repeat